MLVLLQLPQVQISPKSWAHVLLREKDSVREPLGLARWGGYGDLRKGLLPKGDEEIRVWIGFGITNLQGFVLRKRAGGWTATRLVGGIPGTEFHSKKRFIAKPKSGWPTFWKGAEALWTLPDDSTLPQKDRVDVTDGTSYLVETQRSGVYRAYAYDNPDLQMTWPEAGRMAALGQLLGDEFPLPKD